MRSISTSPESGAFSCEWLPPSLRTLTRAAGEIIFRRGDPAEHIYLLLDGNVHLEEMDRTLEAGDLFGGIGVFSRSHQCVHTARAISDVELLQLTEEQFAELCYRDPGVAFHCLRHSIDLLPADAAPENAQRPEPATKPADQSEPISSAA